MPNPQLFICILLIPLAAIVFVIGRAVLRAMLAMRAWNPTGGAIQIVSRDDPSIDPQLLTAIRPLVEHFEGRGYSEIGRMATRPFGTLLGLEIVLISSDSTTESWLNAIRPNRVLKHGTQIFASLDSLDPDRRRICTSNSPFMLDPRSRSEGAATLVSVRTRDPELLIALHAAHVADEFFSPRPIRRTIEEAVAEVLAERGRAIQAMLQRGEIDLTLDQQLMRLRWRALLTSLPAAFSPARTAFLARERRRVIDLFRRTGVPEDRLRASGTWVGDPKTQVSMK